MARSTSGSGLISNYAPGQENYNEAVLFDQHSTSTLSHAFVVDNNFVRVAAFNLGAGDLLTIEQITGTGAGDLIADYSPVNGPVTLYYNSATDQRTSYVLERPGRYRVRYTGSALGMFKVFQIQYFIENEASQDIADALFAVLKEFKPTPCSIGQLVQEGTDPSIPTNVLSIDAHGCIVEYPYTPPTPCALGNIIDTATPPNPAIVIGKDAEGCLIDFPLAGVNNPNAGLNFIETNTVRPVVSTNQVQEFVKISAAAGNEITANSDGIYAPSSGGPPTPPTRCNIGALATIGNPQYLLGIDSSGCLVYFTLNPGDGIQINNTTNSITIVNQCFPCGVAPEEITGNLCITTAPHDLSAACDSDPGSVTYNETLVFHMTSITGGTGPYTYDWSNFSGAATWGVDLGGTPTETDTPVTSTLTVSCTLTGADASSASTFHYAITTGSYVEVTDSASNTQKWYFNALNTTGNCSAVHTAPGSGQIYNNTIGCTESCDSNVDVTVEGSFTAGTPAAGNNLVGAAASVDNLNVSECCAGFFRLLGTFSVQISDPLNTMGTGPTYNAVVNNNTVFPNIADPGGGPDTDWPASITVTSDGISWAGVDPCTGLGHGPEHNVSGHVMTLDLDFSYVVPSALTTDGAHHDVTINISDAEVFSEVGDGTASGCCPADFNTAISDQVIHTSFEG